MRVYGPPSNSNENNNHLSQSILNFSVDFLLVILIGDFNLPLNDWGNVHPFQDDFKPTTQAFVDAGMNQWVTKSTFLRSGNILDLVFTSVIDRNVDMYIHCPFPHCGHCPIVFDYIHDFSYDLTLKKLVCKLGGKENIL